MDICADGVRYLYACDMVLNKVWKIDSFSKNFRPILFLQGGWLSSPSAICYEKNKIYLASFKNGMILEIDLIDKFMSTYINESIPQVLGIFKKDEAFYIAGGKYQGELFKFKNKIIDKRNQLSALPGDILVKGDIVFTALRYRDEIEEVRA